MAERQKETWQEVICPETGGEEKKELAQRGGRLLVWQRCDMFTRGMGYEALHRASLN